jgi:hypothetical protein
MAKIMKETSLFRRATTTPNFLKRQVMEVRLLITLPPTSNLQ